MRNVYEEPAAARRYDVARSLPPETILLWLEVLRSSIPEVITKILDLGCGTGRFTSALAETFDAVAVGVEPSKAMLDIAILRGDPNIEWKRGQAESIPVVDGDVDLVYMSQVFHHVVDRAQAFTEIGRVLKAGGYLAIRNGTREHNDELYWLKFFPAAYEIEQRRTPSSDEIFKAVCGQSFVMVTHRVLRQLFASSYAEYFEKISQRALSALLAISDEDFAEGLTRFRAWIEMQPADVAVYEPVDLFIFKNTRFKLT